jgi:hypothetical protein
MDADDIRYVLSTVPLEWLTELKSVRVQGSGNFASDRHAEFFLPTNHMRVFCRGIRIEIVTRDILRELAAAQLGIPYSFRRKYTKDQLRLINAMIEPYLNSALAPRMHFTSDNPGRPVEGLFPPSIAARGKREKRVRE